MPSNGPTSIDRAVHTANAWLADVARAFGTNDRRFAYRVLRTWLHLLRDRMPINSSAHFAAQLPELLRGTYYDGWDPAKTPVKYHREEYVRRFAADTNVPLADAPTAIRAVSGALDQHLSHGSLSTVLDQLPGDLRELIGPESSGTVPAVPSRHGGNPLFEQRLARLEEAVRALTEAMRTLTQGLEGTPMAEPDPDQGAKAARLAHEILLTVPADIRR